MKLKRLSIGTFNLYNLNETGLPIYTDTSGWSQAEYERKIGWTSRSPTFRSLSLNLAVLHAVSELTLSHWKQRRIHV